MQADADAQRQIASRNAQRVAEAIGTVQRFWRGARAREAARDHAWEVLRAAECEEELAAAARRQAEALSVAGSLLTALVAEVEETAELNWAATILQKQWAGRAARIQWAHVRAVAEAGITPEEMAVPIAAGDLDDLFMNAGWEPTRTDRLVVLRAEYAEETLGAVKKRARDLGCGMEACVEFDESDDPREAALLWILAADQAAAADGSEDPNERLRQRIAEADRRSNAATLAPEPEPEPGVAYAEGLRLQLSLHEEEEGVAPQELREMEAASDPRDLALHRLLER